MSSVTAYSAVARVSSSVVTNQSLDALALSLQASLGIDHLDDPPSPACMWAPLREPSGCRPSPKWADLAKREPGGASSHYATTTG